MVMIIEATFVEFVLWSRRWASSVTFSYVCMPTFLNLSLYLFLSLPLSLCLFVSLNSASSFNHKSCWFINVTQSLIIGFICGKNKSAVINLCVLHWDSFSISKLDCGSATMAIIVSVSPVTVYIRVYIYILIYREGLVTLRNWIMILWRLASPKFAGWTGRLDTRAEPMWYW